MCMGVPIYGTLGIMQKIRTVVYLDKRERDALLKISKKTGAPVAELVRRAITAYLKGK
jgi:hypothetical protein